MSAFSTQLVSATPPRVHPCRKFPPIVDALRRRSELVVSGVFAFRYRFRRRRRKASPASVRTEAEPGSGTTAMATGL